MTTTIKNYEYEAKVFQDLVCYFGENYCPDIGSIDQSPDFMDEYKTWITGIVGIGDFTENDVTQFNNLCEEWVNNRYNTTFDPDFTPEIILEYF
ncbi:MAG: hypothetical protein AB2L24_07865 [Mangrovibacterium sp.]